LGFGHIRGWNERIPGFQSRRTSENAKNPKYRGSASSQTTHVSTLGKHPRTGLLLQWNGCKKAV
jgi:hypothetical protein